jgi:hypothetical protein
MFRNLLTLIRPGRMVLNMFSSSSGHSRTWASWVAVPALLALGATLVAPARAIGQLATSTVEITVVLAAATALALAAVGSPGRRAPWVAACLGLLPFAATALVLDRALGVFDAIWLSVHDIPLAPDLDPSWFGVGRGPVLAIVFALATLSLVGPEHPATKVAAVLQLAGGALATALMPWNLGPYEADIRRIAVSLFAASLAALALGTADETRRPIGVVAAVAAGGAPWLRPGAAVVHVAIAIGVIGLVAAAVWALDRPLPASADRLVAERFLSGAGAIAAAFGGVAAVAVLWHLGRRRAPAVIDRIVELQRVSIVGCTVGFTLALVLAPTIFLGLLVMIPVLLFAVGIGVTYLVAAVVTPLYPQRTGWGGAADAAWLWAFRNRFMQGVQVITFVAVHGFMVWVTRGLWLVPPVVAGLCWLASSGGSSMATPTNTWPAPHLTQPQH